MERIERNALRFDFLERVIKGVSNKVNKKALKEIIEDNESATLNNTMFKYYERIKSIKNSSTVSNHVAFVYLEDFDNQDDFKKYLKENYSAKWYKTPYDYKALGKVKQRNTGLFVAYYDTWRNYGFYAFDCLQYAKENNININAIN